MAEAASLDVTQVLTGKHLLFAGSTLQTLVNPIADVLTELSKALALPSLTVVTV